MTLHPIRILPDGTRVYSNYTKYKPRSGDERTYRKFPEEDPRAYRWQKTWFWLRDVLEDSERKLPETRPDSEAYDHARNRAEMCWCDVCCRPASMVQKYYRKGRRDRKAALDAVSGGGSDDLLLVEGRSLDPLEEQSD